MDNDSTSDPAAVTSPIASEITVRVLFPSAGFEEDGVACNVVWLPPAQFEVAGARHIRRAVKNQTGARSVRVRFDAQVNIPSRVQEFQIGGPVAIEVDTDPPDARTVEQVICAVRASLVDAYRIAFESTTGSTYSDKNAADAKWAIEMVRQEVRRPGSRLAMGRELLQALAEENAAKAMRRAFRFAHRMDGDQEAQ